MKVFLIYSKVMKFEYRTSGRNFVYTKLFPTCHDKL